jgi:hypothetical protein
VSGIQARIFVALVVVVLSLAVFGKQVTGVLLINSYFWWVWRENTKKRPPWVWEACLVLGATLEIAVPVLLGDTLLANAAYLAIAVGWYAAGGWLATRMSRRDEADSG